MNIFLSYSHKDKDAALTLQKALFSGGQTVWMDDGLTIGHEWRTQLADEIARADAIALAITSNWLASPYCQWEFVTAVEQGKKIILVMLEAGLKLPDRLSKYQYADFTNGFNDPAKTQKFLDDLLKLAVTVDKSTVAGVDKEQYAMKIDQQNSDGGQNLNVPGSGNTIAGRDLDQSSTSVKIGGNVQGGNVVIGGKQTVGGNLTITMHDLTQTISKGKAAPSDKETLQKLMDDLKTTLMNVPSEHEESGKKVVERTEELVTEVSRPQADPEDVKDSANKLKRAAENIKAVLPAVFTIATSIIAHVLKMSGAGA